RVARATSHRSSGISAPRRRARAASAPGTGGNARVTGDPEAQRQLDRARDADAPPARDTELARAVGRQDDERAAREIGAVVVQREAERAREVAGAARERSEEHTSELQSPDHLVCR